MNATYLILLRSLAQIMIIILIGFFARKWNIITDSGIKTLSKCILIIFMPCNILASANRNLTADSVSAIVKTLAVSFGYYSLSLLLSYVLFRMIKMDDKKRGVATTSAVFQNTGFIGCPVCESLFGAEGLGLGVTYQIFYDVFMNTLGVGIMSGKKNSKFSVKQLCTPILIATVVANVLFLSGHKWPDLFYRTFSSVGAATTPVSLIVIGAGLVGMDFKSVFTSPLSYFVVFLRNVAFPLIMLLVLKFIPSLPPMAKAVCVIQTAVPVGSLNVIFCRDYGGDYEFANKVLLLSMILSLITLPVIIGLVV